jgi:hypothetical protein
MTSRVQLSSLQALITPPSRMRTTILYSPHNRDRTLLSLDAAQFTASPAADPEEGGIVAFCREHCSPWAAMREQARIRQR